MRVVSWWFPEFFPSVRLTILMYWLFWKKISVKPWHLRPCWSQELPPLHCRPPLRCWFLSYNMHLERCWLAASASAATFTIPVHWNFSKNCQTSTTSSSVVPKANNPWLLLDGKRTRTNRIALKILDRYLPILFKHGMCTPYFHLPCLRS